MCKIVANTQYAVYGPFASYTSSISHPIPVKIVIRL